MSTLSAIIRRDLRIALRHKSQLMPAPTFFVIAISLFPLALGADPQKLSLLAPGLLCVAALLATMLALESLFRADRDDGTLDVLALSPAPMSFYTAGKISAHWLLTGLPLLVLSPLMALMLGLPIAMTGLVITILLPVTLLLILLGSLGAALSLGARQGSVLLALLVLPLYIPVLIFGAGAIDLAQSGGDYTMPLLLLWAILALAIPLAPLTTAAILREQL